MEKKTQGQRRTLPKPVKKLFWAGRLAIGAAAFVPLFLFMVLFNFKVDCQGYFQGDQELRDVVELRFDQGFKVGEIADVRGVSRFAVNRRLNRALAELRRGLEGKDEA